MSTQCNSITSSFCGSLCRKAVGGVNRIYIGNCADVDTTKITISDEDGVTELSIDALYCYIPAIDSASWSENVNVSPENGTTYFEQAVTFVLTSTSQALRNCVRDLAGASNIIVIVRDNNGKMFLVGDPYAKQLTYLSGADTNSGTAYGDRNGTSLTITSRSNEPAPEVNPGNGSDLADALAAADAACDGSAS